MAETTAGAAERLVRYAIAGLSEIEGMSQADAGRALLVAIAQWFGIDFPREAERAEDVAIDLDDVEKARR